jgi:lipopolysaccharide assembly outer membrane protein LptD (OstA)
MTRFPAIVLFAFLSAIFPFIAVAQEQPTWDIQALNQIIPGAKVGNVEFDFATDTATGTDGVYVKYGTTVLTADTVSVNEQTGDVNADGHVRIGMGDQIWVGDHIRYNMKTHQMQSEQFRTGKPPIFAAGKELSGNTTNQTYHARHAFVTTDDVADPTFRVRSSHIKIVPGKYVEMWNAVLFMGDVPTFYFPYYRRNLGPHASNLNFTAGYRSSYGGYLLNTYTWWLNDVVDGKVHLDYRTKRGVGLGPDINLHFGQWGNATFKYYYLHDRDQYESTNGLPDYGPINENRQRVYFGWQATPATNLNVKALVNYQSDAFVEHDFFEGDYLQNPQPNTFFELNKYSENWSLDALTTPEVNNFFDQVERLPDVRLTGFRQQILDTPVYYDSESSAGYYKTFFAQTNGVTQQPAYSAARADTYHQLLLPWTFFDWLNVTPRVGERLTYYSSESGPGGTNAEAYRAVFNTGIGASFKASQLWTGATNSFLQVNGLRHVIQPSVNYVFVPDPSVAPAQLPQFDSASPSLLLLPIEFPDYNNIDSVDSQNVMRLGVRNTLQTMRDGQLDNLVDWNLTIDWRLNPGSTPNNLDEPYSPQQTFSDLYSDFTFKPRSWILLQSKMRESVENGDLNFAFHQLTFTPNEHWSWGLGLWYLRNGFDGFNESADSITSTFYYRLDDNWGFRMGDYIDAADGRLQQQTYTVYRDMRSWTGALTLRVINNSTGPTDVTVAFTFSLKAMPSRQLGQDTVSSAHLLGN